MTVDRGHAIIILYTVTAKEVKCGKYHVEKNIKYTVFSVMGHRAFVR